MSGPAPDLRGAFKANLDLVMVRFGRDLEVRQAAAGVAAAAAEPRSRFTRAWSLR